MDIKITPAKLHGTAKAMPSKSHAHRLLIANALAGEATPSWNFSKDIEATVDCLNSLFGEDAPVLDCGESGSTLRFLLPVAMTTGKEVTFCGSGRLPERPMKPLIKEMEAHGCSFFPAGDEKLFTVRGKLTGGEFSLPGDVTSQFFSGLLFALPLIGGGRIRATSEIESSGYIEMTISVLRQFGIEVEFAGNAFTVKAGQKYIAPDEIEPECDWSNGAFWLAASALGSDVLVTGLSDDTAQGDAGIVGLLPEILKGSAVIDVSQIPDLLPIMAVVAAAAPCATTFVGASRLRGKESDRLSAAASLIECLGGRASEGDDYLEVMGGTPMRGGRTQSFNDHRIVMAAALASTICTGPVTIYSAEAISKSWPGFFEEFNALGGEAHEINIR